MSTKKLSITSVTRKRLDGDIEELAFSSGVNVLVGEGNTGKTKWFETIDYLMGDEVSAEERKDPDNVLFSLFEKASAVLDIGGEKLNIERRWKEIGSLGKVYVNGVPEDTRDFCHRLMRMLDIPIVHFPQGNPYSMRKWPELGWRALFRHLYRREVFWSDLADLQPEADQHAAVMQFLGIAEKLFSVDYSDLVAKNKHLWELQAQRDQFVNILNQVSKDLLGMEGLSTAVTSDILGTAQDKLKEEGLRLVQGRTQLLGALENNPKLKAAAKQYNIPNFINITERLANLQTESESLTSAMKRTAERISEVTSDSQLLTEELGRLKRAEEGGKALADLRVTNCPACDRPIEKPLAEDICYVCGRPIITNATPISSVRRIEFEIAQAQSEIEETAQLLRDLKQEHTNQQARKTKIIAEVERLRNILQPIQQAAATVLPPELFFLDTEYGRIQERRQHLTRLRQLFIQYESLADSIQKIEKEILEIEAAVQQKNSDIDFENAGHLLEEGMNTYLARIVKLNPNSWLGKLVTVHLGEQSLRIKVGESSWKTKLGATQRLYFLFAYHYALMNLVQAGGTLFPGFLMLDFPANLEDRAAIADKENFILEPFVELLRHEKMEGCQVLAAGRSFQQLQGVRTIELNKVWKD
jgi:hypothetical protein